MPCEERWYEVQNIEKGLAALELAGFKRGDPAYDALYKQRGAALTTARRASTREIRPTAEPTLTSSMGVSDIFGRMEELGLGFLRASPEISRELLAEAQVRVWFDSEQGWKAEARMRPGAPPIYHQISSEEAISILQDRATPELLAKLLHPEEYLGE